MKFWRVSGSILRKPTVIDGIIGIIFVTLALLNLHVNWERVQPAISPALAIGLTLAAFLPLTWRRRFPLFILGSLTAIVIVYRYLNIPEGTMTA